MRVSNSIQMVLFVAAVFSPLLATTSAFQPAVMSTTNRCFLSTTTTTKSTTTQLAGVLWDPTETDDTHVDFPTPTQKKILTKEATKRQARRELTQYFLPVADTNGPFSSDTVAALQKLLNANELVDVRGISKDDRKQVFNVATRLLYDLEEAMQKQVSIITKKGHSCVIYAPMDNENNDSATRIKLRTSVGQKNVWERRVKAPRDHRGQIVMDHNQDE